MRGASGAALVALAATAASGCYRVRELEARDLLGELRAESPAPRASAPHGAPDVASLGALTADRAVALALDANPDLRVLRKQRQIASGQMIASRAVANPTLELQLMHLQQISGVTPVNGGPDLPGQTAWSVQFAWEPPQPVVMMARIAGARAQAVAVSADIAEAEWQLEVAVRAAHAQLVALAEERRIVEQAIDTRRRIRDLVEKRVGGGASTRLDLGLAELAVTQVERDRDDLVTREVSAGRDLAGLLGVPRSPAVAGTIPDDPDEPAALDALEDTALSSRPALGAEAARYKVREQSVRQEHAQRWPWFSFTAAPRYRSNDTRDNPRDWGVGVQITLPVFNFNSGPIAVAEASRDQEREQFRKLLASLRVQLGAAREQILVRRATVQRYRDRILPALALQEKNLSVAVAAGQIDLVAVLAAQDLILRSRRDFIGQELALHQAWLQLDGAAGRHLFSARPDDAASRGARSPSGR